MFAFPNSDIRKQLSDWVLAVPKSRKDSRIWFYQYHIKGDLLSELSARFLPPSIANYEEFDYNPRCDPPSFIDQFTWILLESLARSYPDFMVPDKKRAGVVIYNAHSMSNFLHEVFLNPTDRCDYNKEIKKELPKWRLKDVFTALGAGGLLALGIGLLNKNSIQRLQLQEDLEVEQVPLTVEMLGVHILKWELIHALTDLAIPVIMLLVMEMFNKKIYHLIL
jgi:hypothetical protein